MSEYLDADSVASCIDGIGLSDNLFVKTNVDCENGGLLEGGDIFLEAISIEETSFKNDNPTDFFQGPMEKSYQQTDFLLKGRGIFSKYVRHLSVAILLTHHAKMQK